MTLLEPSLLARLERLQLATRTRLIGKFGGEHRSNRYGNALEFADFREYHPGDDYRRIDYHVLARLDQVLLRLHEAEDEITIRLLIDTSASMAVGGKMEQAKRVAAALGFVALVTHDAVTVHTFPATTRAPRFVGRNAAPALFAVLTNLEPSGRTPFAQATAHLLARPGPPGMTVVVSDMLTPDWEAVVKLRARGSELVVLHMLTRHDTDPDLLGDLELVDYEAGDRLVVSMTDEVRLDYRARVDAWHDRIAQRCRGIGAAYVPVAADADLERLLLTTWRTSGVMR